MSDRGDVTSVLHAWNRGDPNALEALLQDVADDLRIIARRVFSAEPQGHTLQPTALVNELYLRFTGMRTVQWKGRREFFAVASKLLRRVLVDHARGKMAHKRGQGEPKLRLDECTNLSACRAPELVALDAALDELKEVDPRASQIVELHSFVGLDFDQIAEVVGVSRRTALRDWKHAKLWLHRELNSQ